MSRMRAGVAGLGAIVVILSAPAQGRAIAATPAGAGAAPAAVATTLAGTVSPLVRVADLIGPTAGGQRLQMVAALRLPNRSALDDYVTAEYTPGSPEFHRFLSPAEFGSRFGAPGANVDAVVTTLRHLGFSVTAPLANHLMVDFEGTVAQAESAFVTQIADFRAPDGSSFFANTRNLVLPAALSPLVTTIVGLDNANKRHPQLALRPGAPGESLLNPFEPLGPPHHRPAVMSPAQARADAALVNAPAVPASPPVIRHAVPAAGGASPCAAGSVGYTAPDFASAYDFNGLYAAGLHGEGMSAALVEFDDYHTSDVATLESCYAISPDPVVRREVDGGLGAPPTDGGGEDPLDFDIMLEMLPKLQHLYIYVAPNTDTSELDLYNDFATDTLAPVLSSSWGSCEALNSQGYTQAFAVIAEEAAAQGQQIADSAGDSGPVDCRGFPAVVVNALNPEEEAAIPWITAVGGTNLNPLSLSGPVRREVTWNDLFGAGGSGVSTVWVMPAWQQNAHGTVIPGMSSAAPCNAPPGKYCRQIPDISANADILGAPRLLAGSVPNPDGTPGSPGYAYFCGSTTCSLVGPVPVVGNPSGWNVNGGTSASTPLTASAFVLFDQMAKQKGMSGLGLLNPSIYRVASDPAKYAADFFDITSDSNSDQYASDISATPTAKCMPAAGCNPSHLYPATPGYDLATGWGAYDAAKLGADLVADAGHLDLTPDDLPMYAYLGGPATTTSVMMSSGYAVSAVTMSSDSGWLSATAGSTPGLLHLRADPTGLTASAYTGHLTVTGPSGSATVTVRYSVTPRAVLSASPGALSFTEYAVDTSGNKVAQSCTATWKDEFEPQINTGDTTPTPGATLQTLTIANHGPAGSVLHWSALIETDNGGWLVPDFNPNPGASGPPPSVPVPTEGSLGGGASTGVKLASVASAASFGNYHFAPGQYHGAVALTDLADPSVHLTIPANLVLGDGNNSPRINPNVGGLTAAVAPGAKTTVTLTLSDAAKSCGYFYSVAVQSATDAHIPWASLPDPGYSGVVGGTDSSAAATSPATAQVPISIDSAGLKPGTYTALIKVQSVNAGPQPFSIPLILTVLGGTPVVPPPPVVTGIPSGLVNTGAASASGAAGAVAVAGLWLLTRRLRARRPGPRTR